MRNYLCFKFSLTLKGTVVSW